MTLPLLRLVAASTDDEDFYRRLIEDRDATADQYRDEYEELPRDEDEDADD